MPVTIICNYKPGSALIPCITQYNSPYSPRLPVTAQIVFLEIDIGRTETDAAWNVNQSSLNIFCNVQIIHTRARFKNVEFVHQGPDRTGHNALRIAEFKQVVAPTRAITIEQQYIQPI